MTTRTEVQVEFVVVGLCVDVEELLEVVELAVGAVVGTMVPEGPELDEVKVALGGGLGFDLLWDDELFDDV